MTPTEEKRNFTKADGVSQKEYFEAILGAMDKAFDARIESMQMAVNLAKQDMERRMDGFPNQFVKKGETDVAITQLASDMKTLNEIKNTYLSRTEFDMAHTRLNDDVRSLQDAKNQMEGKASQNSMVLAIAVSSVSFIMALIGLMLRFLRV
jgi:multidrug resistance efflux pump